MNIAIVLGLFPLTSRNPFRKYEIPAVLFIISWVATSYLLGRYVGTKKQIFEKAGFRLFYTGIINFSLFGGFILLQHASAFSQYVLFSIMSGILISEYLFFFIYFAYKYAVQYDIPISTAEERENAVLLPSEPLTEKEVEDRKKTLIDFTNEKTYKILNKEIELTESAVSLHTRFEVDEFQNAPQYRYSTFVQLRPLNKIRGINKMLYLFNEKLPDDGRIAVFYTSKSTKKINIFKRYPVIIRNLVYFFYFIFHRVLPKFFLTQRLYFDITKGERRILSKTEVLGRLVFCGFQIEKQKKIGDVNMVIARRVKQSESIKPRRNYGPFIKLTRFGKNRKPFYVYKMRTMHPYSEFLQNYVYETNSLQEGGKFNKDIRVTTLGRFMRRYWLDELPMLINLIIGDMKIIGVRPLSAQYFSLYSKELQEKRIKFRPGLLRLFTQICQGL
ncbi:MAG: sugar transferase [Paludibacteraceae bacterium]